MKNTTNAKEAFSTLLEVMATLRKECPWDRKQTMESLRSLTIEEVYELGDAVLSDNMEEVKKELGDLMMHLVFYACIAEEKGDFEMADVLTGVCEKLRYRHPHIYGDVSVKDENDVSRNWEKLKLKEKDRDHTVLGGVPQSLPALVKAYRIQDKVRAVGFDWKKKEHVWEKVREELEELEVEIQRGDTEKAEEEFGDFMFSIINASRTYGINPDNALEKTNRKFIKRFSYIENKARQTGRNVADLSLEEMNDYWDEAKKN
ncbi:nucleoside triphosphate pyrophosphohydrolase [Bacteroidia bacterium]|nr:nucleoside triphosphate pyrophosphohydrolase [Bacteroidia bacterium]